MLKRKPKTENEKTEEYFHREVFPMINAFAKECKGHAKQKITVKGIFSNEQIYTQVWKEPYYGAEDNVMGIIRRIRKKIEPDSAKPRYILNVWGMGYKFNGELMK